MGYDSVAIIFAGIATVSMAAAIIAELWRQLSGIDDGTVLLSLSVTAISLGVAFTAAFM